MLGCPGGYGSAPMMAAERHAVLCGMSGHQPHGSHFLTEAQLIAMALQLTHTPCHARHSACCVGRVNGVCT